MTTVSWIDLVEKNATEFGELVAGIDPHLPELPAFFDHRRDGSWIGDYVTFMLELLKGQVGFVKFQSAYFEACGLKGPDGTIGRHWAGKGQRDGSHSRCQAR